MKPVTRRSVMAGSAAVVAAVPALAVATKVPMERVKRLTKELVTAMTEAYGAPVPQVGGL